MNPSGEAMLALAEELDGLAELLSKENTGSDAGFDAICNRAAALLRSPPHSPDKTIPMGTREELAATIHKARWPADRVMQATPFADEDRNGREYCFRIADAILSLPAVPMGTRERNAVIEECAKAAARLFSGTLLSNIGNLVAEHIRTRLPAAQADEAGVAMERIHDLLSSGDRPTVNKQNAFEHFTALNELLVEVRGIARTALAVTRPDRGGPDDLR